MEQKQFLDYIEDKTITIENDNSSVIHAELDSYKFMFMGDAGL